MTIIARRLGHTKARSGLGPTSPMRILSSDHQPIRLIADLEGVSPPEVVHEALVLYMERHRDALAELAAVVQEAVATSDIQRLEGVLRALQADQKARRAGRLKDISEPIG